MYSVSVAAPVTSHKPPIPPPIKSDDDAFNKSADDPASYSELSAIPESEDIDLNGRVGDDEIMESTPRLSPHAHLAKFQLPSGERPIEFIEYLLCCRFSFDIEHYLNSKGVYISIKNKIIKNMTN